MSIEQKDNQTAVFQRKEPITREYAIKMLHAIGVMNLDGTYTDEYKFFETYGRKYGYSL